MRQRQVERDQVGRVGWDKECSYRLPVAVWRAMIDHHFGGQAWLRLGRDSYDRLAEWKAKGTYLTWDDAIGALLGDP